MKLGPKVFPKLFPKQTDTHTPCQTRQQVFLTAEDDTTTALDNVRNNRTGPEDGVGRRKTASDDGRRQARLETAGATQKTRRAVVATVQITSQNSQTS